MVTNPYLGKFILLGGYDGSGKDTQASRLELALKAQYPQLKLLRPFPKEPTKGPIGRRIYDILFDRDPEFTLKSDVNNKIKITDFEFQKFFVKDRIQHYRDVIIPALALGINVICNRGIESTIAYGGNTTGELNKIIARHENMFFQASVPLIWPDLIVIYDVTPETALKRMKESGKECDAFENELKARRVTSNYRALAALYPNCKLVDAEPEGEEGQKEIFCNARQYIYPVIGITNF